MNQENGSFHSNIIGYGFRSFNVSSILLYCSDMHIYFIQVYYVKYYCIP